MKILCGLKELLNFRIWLLVSFVIQIARAEVFDIHCSESESFVNYPQPFVCNKDNSCILTNLSVPKDSAFTTDRAAHEFKCMIFVDSIVYEIPSSIFSTSKSHITHLYANHVGISELKRISFAFGTNLESVELSGNNIKALSEAVFYDMFHLETLDLSHNQISTLATNAFEKLSSLKILDLSDNEISTIPFEAFQPLNSLVYLKLRNNHIQIKFGIFPEFVKTLDLSYNKLDIYQKFKIFSMLMNLETLLLHGNKIENVHPSIFEETNLRFLGLSDNPFHCSNLADIFLEMRKHGIISTPESFVRNDSNIQGIKCIE